MSHQLSVKVIIAAGLLLAAAGAHAQTAPARKPAAAPVEKVEMASGGTYKCVDADGNTTYTNVGTIKGCKKIEGEVNSVSLPRPGAATTTSRPAAKVDTGAQRTRDTDRKRILEDELAAEEKRLADLKKEFNNGEPERQGGERNYQTYLDRTEKLKADVARSEANVDSLRRELGGVKN